MISSSLRLTHPAGFETRRLPDKDPTQDLQERLSCELDNNVLGAQAKLSKAVAEGQVSVGTFCDSVKDLETFSGMQAHFRADGFTEDEKDELVRTFTTSGQDNPTKLDPELKSLYQQARGGLLSPAELSHELNWRTQRAYGNVVSTRSGPVYKEERYKLRASLYVPRKPKELPDTKEMIHPGLGQLAEKALAAFDRLDKNHDGNVDRIEARHFLTDYQKLNLSPAEAATLYSRQEELAALVDPENSGENLRKEDLELLLPGHIPAQRDETLSELLTKISKRYAAQLKAPAPEPEPFHKDKDIFQPWNVRQGLEGSCWLLCNLPALTDDEISDIVKPEGDGYQVTLADGRHTHVKPLNEAEQRVYSKGDGAWSGVLEKGVSQILQKQGKDINGGFARVARKLLSGHDSEKFSLTEAPAPGQPDFRDRDVLFSTLEQAFRSGSAVFAGTDNADHEKDVSEISASAHAYTVLDVNRQTDTVVVRNPWGRSERADLDGNNNGVFELTQDQFFANFSYIYLDRPAS